MQGSYHPIVHFSGPGTNESKLELVLEDLEIVSDELELRKRVPFSNWKKNGSPTMGCY
jgi:hypothetical protein